MTDVVQDPEGLEVGFMRQLASPSRAKVLEVGCGDGRLTRQYGADASAVYGIDTNLAKLSRALVARPPLLAAKSHFTLSFAEALPFADDSFDLTIMARSL